MMAQQQNEKLSGDWADVEGNIEKLELLVAYVQSPTF